MRYDNAELFEAPPDEFTARSAGVGIDGWE